MIGFPVGLLINNIKSGAVSSKEIIQASLDYCYDRFDYSLWEMKEEEKEYFYTQTERAVQVIQGEPSRCLVMSRFQTGRTCIYYHLQFLGNGGSVHLTDFIQHLKTVNFKEFDPKLLQIHEQFLLKLKAFSERVG